MAGGSIWASGLRGGPGSCALARELAPRDPPRIRPGGSVSEGKGGAAPPLRSPPPAGARPAAAAPPTSSRSDAGGGRGAPTCDAPSSRCPSAAAAVPGAPHGPGRPERALPLTARPRPGPSARKVTGAPARSSFPGPAGRALGPRCPLPGPGWALSRPPAGAVRRRGAEAAQGSRPAPSLVLAPSPSLLLLASPLPLPRPLSLSFFLLALSRLRAAWQSRATRSPAKPRGAAAAGALSRAGGGGGGSTGGAPAAPRPLRAGP